jgi:hypothetical protein
MRGDERDKSYVNKMDRFVVKKYKEKESGEPVSFNMEVYL